MGTFVRTTLIVAAVIAGIMALGLLLKLLVVAALAAALALGVVFLARRLMLTRGCRVTRLTARR